MRLKNKVCLITGSSKGIGAGIAEEFAKQGAKVIITYNTKKTLAQKIFKKINASAMYKLDVRRKKNISLVFKKVKKKFGRLDVLVNNAGVNKTSDFDKLSEKDWDYVLENMEDQELLRMLLQKLV